MFHSALQKNSLQYPLNALKIHTSLLGLDIEMRGERVPKTCGATMVTKIVVKSHLLTLENFNFLKKFKDGKKITKQYVLTLQVKNPQKKSFVGFSSDFLHGITQQGKNKIFSINMCPRLPRFVSL